MAKKAHTDRPKNSEGHEQRRAFNRVEANLDVHCFDIRHFGTVTDLSEKGMFLRSNKIHFPFDAEFEVSLPIDHEVLKLPVAIKRLTKSDHYYDGMGVELLETSREYLDLLSGLRSGSIDDRLSHTRPHKK